MTRIVRFKVPVVTKNKKKEIVPTEEQDQIKLVVWVRKMGFPIVASANGGKRNLYEAIKLKRMGVSAGFPDLFMPVVNKTFSGLFIELKRVSGGVVSDSQLEWMKILRQNGYSVEICRGFEQAKQVITDYLANTNKAA